MSRPASFLRRALRPLPLLLAVAGAQTGAHATSLRLAPAEAAAQVGDQLELALWMDFSDDPTLGGGLDLGFDAARLLVTGFSFDAGLADDPALRRLPDAGPGLLSGLGFGHFNGLAGPARVGSFSVQVLAPGLATLALAPNADPVGSFYSAQTFGVQAPQLSGASLAVSPVPEPGAAWLLLAGLGWLGLGGRLRSSRPACARSPRPGCGCVHPA